MSKFYIHGNKGRQIYGYIYQDDRIVYTKLKQEEKDNLLKSIATEKLINVEETAKSLEITLRNNITIIIDDIHIFLPKESAEDHYFESLLSKIKSFIEAREIEKYSKALPPKYIPRVNRQKPKSLSKKMMITSVLSMSILATLIAGALNREINRTENTPLEPQATIELSTDSLQKIATTDHQLPEIMASVNPMIKVEIGFDDLTASGKLEQTIELCAPYLDPWIERYGLPRDLTYALVCQEYGLLDCTINSSGACGPMQLQVASFHNDNAIEFCQVPVYKDGELTGEYDEFYIADERKLDDPRLIGKNYLVMQNLDNNFQIGCAQFRRCIDKYKNIFIAVDAYNKGLYAMSSVCSEETLAHYQENFSDFSWTDVIPNNYGENYGDKNYIWNVLRYLDTDNRGSTLIEYEYLGEKITVDLTNTNVYNNELSR